MKALASCLWVMLPIVTGCGPPDSPFPIQARQVWTGEDPDFLSGDVSPDGRYFSDIDWDSGDLRLVNLETGETRGLTGGGYDDGGYAWTSAFSTSGRDLAVSWYLYEQDSHALKIVDVHGGSSRVLVPASEELYYIDPLDWSPWDDQILVALRYRDDLDWRLGLVSVSDGSVRVLKELGWMAPGGDHTYPRAYWSPDGEYVAYDYRPVMEDRARSIYAVKVDGTLEVTLVPGPGVNRFLGWIPDGSGILFHSDRGGTSGIWRLRLAEGVAPGEPELVGRDLPGVFPLGFVPGGYLHGVGVEAPRIHVARVDLSAGRVLAPPRPVDDPPTLGSLSVDWSPDGSRLAYFTHDSRRGFDEFLVIRSAEGEKLHEVLLPPTLHTSIGTLNWVSEDEFYLFGSAEGRFGVHRMDPRDGRFDGISPPEWNWGSNLKWFQVTSDGGMLFVFRPPGREGEGSDLIALDLDSGRERVVASARGVIPQSLAVSPDGERVAYIARDAAGGALTLWVASTSQSDVPRAVHRATREHRLTPPVAWAPDASRLLIVQVPADGGASGLWSVSAHGNGDAVFMGDGDWCCAGRSIRVHPGGDRLAFVAGRSVGAIWKLEGY